MVATSRKPLQFGLRCLFWLTLIVAMLFKAPFWVQFTVVSIGVVFLLAGLFLAAFIWLAKLITPESPKEQNEPSP